MASRGSALRAGPISRISASTSARRWAGTSGSSAGSSISRIRTSAALRRMHAAYQPLRFRHQSATSRSPSQAASASVWPGRISRTCARKAGSRWDVHGSPASRPASRKTASTSTSASSIVAALPAWSSAAWARTFAIATSNAAIQRSGSGCGKS